MTGRELRLRLLERTDAIYLAASGLGAGFALASALRWEAERLSDWQARGVWPLEDGANVPLGSGGLGLD